jgi:HAE1 family hydrophobic/amphiphilic exporter-1
MISEFCIRRPVATLLMSIALILAGAFAYRVLPVAALPSAEFPVVNVSASLPGASPETMATSGATPLIKQLSTIAGIDTISTSNTLGSTSIAIQFALGRDIDAAAADVQAAIARTQRQLPPQMTSPPSYRKVNPADAPILLLALTSDVTPLTQLDAFAQNVISPALSIIDGVAQVQLFGSRQYAVRIQVDPSLLAARNISVSQLESAISNANSQTPLGILSNDQQQLTITASTQLENAAEFGKLVIAENNGRPVHLGDVAHVIDSVATTTSTVLASGWRCTARMMARVPSYQLAVVVVSTESMTRVTSPSRTG